MASSQASNLKFLSQTLCHDADLPTLPCPLPACSPAPRAPPRSSGVFTHPVPQLTHPGAYRAALLLAAAADAALW